MVTLEVTFRDNTWREMVEEASISFFSVVLYHLKAEFGSSCR